MTLSKQLRCFNVARGPEIKRSIYVVCFNFDVSPLTGKCRKHRSHLPPPHNDREDLWDNSKHKDDGDMIPIRIWWEAFSSITHTLSTQPCLEVIQATISHMEYTRLVPRPPGKWCNGWAWERGREYSDGRGRAGNNLCIHWEHWTTKFQSEKISYAFTSYSQ
jgi:hypothetical protein